MVGGPGAHMPCRSAPPDTLVAPAMSLIHGRGHPRLLHHRSNVGLLQGPRWSGLGSIGPPSYTLELPTDLGTDLLRKQPTYLPCNCHQGAIHHRWMQRRWNQGPADAPWCSSMPQGGTNLPQLSISTLTTSPHYKRGSGAWWRSASFISKLLQALKLSIALEQQLNCGSRARSELSSESRRVFQVWYSSFVILSFSIYFI